MVGWLALPLTIFWMLCLSQTLQFNLVLQSLTCPGIINQSQFPFPSSLNGFLNTIPEGTTINSLNLVTKTLSEREPTYFCPSRIAPATCVTFSWAFFLVAWFGLTATKTVINLLRLPINPAVLGTVDVQCAVTQTTLGAAFAPAGNMPPKQK